MFFHFENYYSHVSKSLFIFKVMLAFNWEMLVLTRNMVMLNRLNQLNLPEYDHECNEKFFTSKITAI